MTHDRSCQDDICFFGESEPVNLGDSKKVDPLEWGKVYLDLLVCEKKIVVMYGILLVPDLTYSPFSVRAATDKGKTVRFRNS